MGEGMSPEPFSLDQVAGMAWNLYNNLMPISGFAQWYPFGVGDWYQERDAASTFRFVLHDGAAGAGGGGAAAGAPGAAW